MTMARAVARRVPADIRSIVQPAERVIAWARDDLGRSLVLTVHAAYLPGTVASGHERFEYESILAVNWDDPSLEVVVGSSARERLRFEIHEPAEVPPVLRERVTATILLSARLSLGDGPGADRLQVGGAAESPQVGPGARITARRESQGDRGVAWKVVFDPGLDPTDSGLRARADWAIAELRSSSGL